MKLIIIRGLPGSGKSTKAREFNCAHFEADMFFMKNNEYCFDQTQLHQCAWWCFKNVKECLNNGMDVVVSNTFTTKNELDPYIKLGEEFGDTVILIEMNYDYCNTHNVPQEVIEKMKSRWYVIN